MLGEVKEAVKKTRAASAPGPNAIPYKVYKMCPLLLRRLWRLLEVVWRKGYVPEAWKEAEGIFTPKERNSKTVNQFRTISLLNVQGKIFFAILARRLTSFLTAFRHYHVDGHIQKIITSYLDGIRLRFTVGDQLTRWQRLKKGIVTGCTVSVVLLIMGMNLLINAAQRETLTRPIKCLGKLFDASLQDRDNVKKLEEQVEEGLKKIDRCGLHGKFKAWLYQHALLPRLIWPLVLYEVPITTVEALERSTSRHLRKWLGVPPSFTSIGLYGKSNKLQLLLSSLVEEFKTAKARLVLTLRDSPDELIPTESVSQAENELKHKDIVGVTAVGRDGIGARKVVLWSRSDQKERRAMIQSEVRRARQARAVEMGAQGACTTWETADGKLTWGDIWKYEPFRFSFLLRSIYDLLPSPANLCRWGLTEDPKCSLCDRVGTLEHVLSSFTTALTQGRYRCRHDLVLRELADWLEKERKKERGNYPRHGHIAFVKSGEAMKTNKPTKASIPDGTRDWKMEVDLGRRLVFPNVVQTTLRPDIVLWSETGKKLFTIELTVPWEARCEEAYERKKAKYTELMDLCKQQGWRTWIFPVEVGVRGFCSQSVHRLMTAV
ncbi:uncharacterized protein LOC127861838 [Dreissena polymorpha]|uniref:uncharacterized protein LOC127861838 n=1 Tax=Dreissena polymorpha TaxID=45954 RepID=UPI0022645520|nr:uncharacterized protein LOC127861838 [Dreissena polymorpha]